MKRQTAITITESDQLEIMHLSMHRAGQAANDAAARVAFDDHVARKANNTIRRKMADLALFETFLQVAGVPASGLFDNPDAWRGVTWGLVESFKAWQLKQGYAIGSINGHLSTVRTYAKLAAKAGSIPAEESILIASVQGYANKEAKNIDAKRRADGIETRIGAKKAQAVSIPADIAEALKMQPNTPKGRRDRLLMCLFLDHGIRVGEAALLTINNFNLKAGTLTFYRPKVNKTQTHQLTEDTWNAAREYITQDAQPDGIIWRRSHKGAGELLGQLSIKSAERALTKRVEILGRHAGIEGLSAHDGRHFWATYEANNNTPVNRLMDAGGWSSPAMPLRYIEASAIANAGTARVDTMKT